MCWGWKLRGRCTDALKGISVSRSKDRSKAPADAGQCTGGLCSLAAPAMRGLLEFGSPKQHTLLPSHILVADAIAWQDPLLLPCSPSARAVVHVFSPLASLLLSLCCLCCSCCRTLLGPSTSESTRPMMKGQALPDCATACAPDLASFAAFQLAWVVTLPAVQHPATAKSDKPVGIASEVYALSV